MKTLLVGRGESIDPIVLANSDKFDSSAVLYDNERELWASEHVATVHTVGYLGGIIAAPQEMYGIKHHKWNTDGTPGRECIRLFNKDTDLTRIKTGDDLSTDNMTLLSSVPNPNHDNACIVRNALVHSCGIAGGKEPTNDWSHACITIWDVIGECDALLKCLQPNEIILVDLT